MSRIDPAASRVRRETTLLIRVPSRDLRVVFDAGVGVSREEAQRLPESSELSPGSWDLTGADGPETTESHLGRIEARRHPAITSLTKLLIPQRSSVGRFIDPPRGFRQITAAIWEGRRRH